MPADIEAAAAADASERRRCTRIASGVDAAVLTRVRTCIFSGVNAGVFPGVASAVGTGIDTPVLARIGAGIHAAIQACVVTAVRSPASVRTAAGAPALLRALWTGGHAVTRCATDVPGGARIVLIAAESHG